MLKKLSEKQPKWLKMAYNLCQDYETAADLVQEMYITVHEILEKNPNKKLKDAYIWGVIRSIHTEEHRKNKTQICDDLELLNASLGRHNTISEGVDDEELIILERFSKVRYLYRNYIERSQEESLRKMALTTRDGYQSIRRRINDAREFIKTGDQKKYKSIISNYRNGRTER